MHERMEDEPENHVQATHITLRGRVHVHKPRLELWISAYAAMAVVSTADTVFRWVNNPKLYYLVNNLPLISCLAYYLFVPPTLINDTEWTARLMIAALVLTVVISVDSVYSAAVHGRLADIHFWIVNAAGMLLFFAVTALVWLALRSEWTSQDARIVYVTVLIVFYCITIPGIMTLFFAVLISGVLLEFCIRLLICKLNYCVITAKKRRFAELSIPIVTMEGRDLEVVHLTCMLCMKDLQAGDEVYRFPCGATHVSHANCLRILTPEIGISFLCVLIIKKRRSIRICSVPCVELWLEEA